MVQASRSIGLHDKGLIKDWISPPHVFTTSVLTHRVWNNDQNKMISHTLWSRLVTKYVFWHQIQIHLIFKMSNTITNTPDFRMSNTSTNTGGQIQIHLHKYTWLQDAKYKYLKSNTLTNTTSSMLQHFCYISTTFCNYHGNSMYNKSIKGTSILNITFQYISL